MMFDIKLIKTILQNPSLGDGTVRMKVSDPKSFNDTQSANDLKNFFMGYGLILQSSLGSHRRESINH